MQPLRGQRPWRRPVFASPRRPRRSLSTHSRVHRVPRRNQQDKDLDCRSWSPLLTQHRPCRHWQLEFSRHAHETVLLHRMSLNTVPMLRKAPRSNPQGKLRCCSSLSPQQGPCMGLHHRFRKFSNEFGTVGRYRMSWSTCSIGPKEAIRNYFSAFFVVVSRPRPTWRFAPAASKHHGCQHCEHVLFRGLAPVSVPSAS